MKNLKILLLALALIMTAACDELKDEERDGNEITQPDNGIGVNDITIFADFDVDYQASRIAQKQGLMILPDTLFVRDFFPTDDISYLQVEVIDYKRAIQVVSVCYRAERQSNKFYYDKTLLEYGNCDDDTAWAHDKSTLNIRLERGDSITISALGDFDGVREEFTFNLVNEE